LLQPDVMSSISLGIGVVSWRASGVRCAMLVVPKLLLNETIYWNQLVRVMLHHKRLWIFQKVVCFERGRAVHKLTSFVCYHPPLAKPQLCPAIAFINMTCQPYGVQHATYLDMSALWRATCLPGISWCLCWPRVQGSGPRGPSHSLQSQALGHRGEGAHRYWHDIIKKAPTLQTWRVRQIRQWETSDVVRELGNMYEWNLAKRPS
jgi:hypothetical protein